MTLIPIPQRRKTDAREVLSVQVRHLPLEYQDVLTLRFVDGLTLEEIAAKRFVSIDDMRQVYIAAMDAIRPHINRSQGYIYGNRSGTNPTDP